MNGFASGGGRSKEVVSLLGDEALPFAAAYGLTDQGNFEGANIPKLRAKGGERDRFAGGDRHRHVAQHRGGAALHGDAGECDPVRVQ